MPQGVRRRSRYASDDVVKRAAKLADETGKRIRMGADGSVEILGPLDSAPNPALSDRAEGDIDADLAEFEAKNGLAGPSRR